MKKILSIRPSNPHQRGFSLLELSIVLVIMALIVMGLIAMQVDQAQSDKARAVAQTYNRMNSAVGSYLTNFYDKLVKLQPECANPNWASQGGVGAPAPDYSACALTALQNNNVIQLAANGLQPTPAELANLGFLVSNQAQVDVLPLDTIWDHAGGVVDFQSSLGKWVMGTNNNALPSRFMVLIQQLCIVPGQGQPVVVTTSRGCASDSVDLRSLVFNSQPYDFVGMTKSAVLDRALIAIGADGYLSDSTTTGGELRALSGAVEATITNPSRFIAGNQGAPNILAIRNGYGSSGWDKFVRRDGSTPMTSDWNYGYTNIENVNNLAVNNNATIGNVVPDSTNGAGGTGSLTVNGVTTLGTDAASKDGSQVLNVKGSANISGNTSIGGALTATSGVFGKVVSKLNAALQAASAYVEGSLTVNDKTTTSSLSVTKDATINGNTTFKSDAYFFGKTELSKLKITNFAKLGDSCLQDDLTLAKADPASAEYSNGLRLLVCNGGKWERPQELAVNSATPSTPVIPKPLSIKGESVDVKYSMPRQCCSINSLLRTSTAAIAEWKAELVSKSRYPTDLGPTMVALSPAFDSSKWFVGIQTDYPADGNASPYYSASQFVAGDAWIVVRWTALVDKPATKPSLPGIGNGCLDNWVMPVMWPAGPLATNTWLAAGGGASPEMAARNYMFYCTEVSRSPGFVTNF